MFSAFTGSRIVPSLVVGLAGQSNADLFSYTEAGAALKERLMSVVGPGTLPNGVALVDLATGGAFASKGNRDYAGGSDAYWWNEANAADAAALANVYAALIAGLASKPTVLAWVQGEADARVLGGADPAAALARYVAATQAAIQKLREACNAGAPTSVPVVVVLIGRQRDWGYAGGIERARQALLDVVAAGANLHRGCELYDLELADAVHPSVNGRRVFGQRLADRIAQVGFGAAGLFRGPSVASVVLTDPQTLELTLAAEAGDALGWPEAVCGLRVEDAAAPGAAVPIAAVEPGAGKLVLRLAAPVSGAPVLFYPYDDVADFDARRVIRGQTSGRPLQTWAR